MTDNDIKYRIPAGFLPVTIIDIKTSKSKAHSEGDSLIEYEYRERVEGFVDEGETSIHARRAEIRAIKDGIVGKIHVKKGDVIENESTILMEYEGCDHDTQYEGICVVCCKTVPKNLKSHVNMTHDATSLSVSRTEAKRLEQATVDRLLSEGKLSLIVDLDQTLIHATVGAAIDEWVNSQSEMPKDIRKFPLPDSPTPYYIKLRPHLETFLERVTSLYELHIYTMGTRNYAAAVANAIDPDGKYFSQRILSRDENSSMTQKTIERLFPCDTSMVVVIDDRADVWQYSPNLVKVHPYEYFVGAGDINAGHLPKQEGTVKSKSPVDPKAPAPSVSASEPSSSTTDSVSDSKTPKEEPSDMEVSPNTDEAKPDTSEAQASTTKDSETEAPKAEASKTEESKTEASPTVPNTPPTTPEKSDETNKVSKPKAPVTEDTDNELKHILEILETIHERFYDAREQFVQGESRKQADVKAIIHDMKKNVLRGVNILFSSVIPLGQAPERTEIWRQARSFGAECWHELTSEVTHVVAAKPGTAKVVKARQRKKVKIVRPEWLYHSIGKWQRQDESKYLLLEAPGKSTPVPSTPSQMTDADAEDAEDEDQGGVSEGMDENHIPLSINKEEVNEHLKTVNWDDMGKEVEDFVGDLDDTDFDSDTSTHSNTQSDGSTDRSRSSTVNLKRPRTLRKSGLGATVTFGDDDSDDEDTDSISGLAMDDMGDMGDTDRQVASDDSDGDIDEESGSDGDEESDADQPLRGKKRRRLSSGKGKKSSQLIVGSGEDGFEGADDYDDAMDADDDTTMDHSANSKGRIGGDEDDEDDEDDEEVDDDFLNTLENDIDAQLNEDED